MPWKNKQGTSLEIDFDTFEKYIAYRPVLLTFFIADK